MDINLIFNFYANNLITSEDYFSDILKKIPSDEYPHIVNKSGLIYIPVDVDDLVRARQKGLQIVEKDGNNCFIIKQMIVSFMDVGREFSDVLEHIITEFGEKANKYQVIEEGILNDKGFYAD